MFVEVKGSDAIIADFRDMPVKVRKGNVRAINRAITSGRAVMAKFMASDTGLKSSDIKAALRIRNATIDNPAASIGTKQLDRIPLVKFGATGPEPSRGRGRGVSAKMQGARKRYKDAFLATMPTGHRGVYVRVAGAGRLPIKQLYGPSLGRVFAKYRPEGVARISEQYEKELAHELKRIDDAVAI